MLLTFKFPKFQFSGQTEPILIAKVELMLLTMSICIISDSDNWFVEIIFLLIKYFF
jgi:hypothetical protein